eukprot:1948113-Rhodomonas_salina.3
MHRLSQTASETAARVRMCVGPDRYRESVFVRELRPVLHRPRLHDGAHGPGTPDRDRRQRSLIAPHASSVPRFA